MFIATVDVVCHCFVYYLITKLYTGPLKEAIRKKNTEKPSVVWFFSFQTGWKIEWVFEQHTVLSLIMDCNPGWSLELGATEASQAARQPGCNWSLWSPALPCQAARWYNLLSDPNAKWEIKGLTEEERKKDSKKERQKERKSNWLHWKKGESKSKTLWTRPFLNN